MATIAELLERNKAVDHVPLHTLAELRASGKRPVRTLVVTCCDPRCIPERYFDLTHLQAIVHRNAGGAIRDALRDILILDTLFKLEEIAIVHHTDCGTLCFTDDQIRSSVKEWVDKAHWAEIDEMAFGGKSDIVQGVKRDLQWVRESPFIRDALKKGTQGFVFDLKTGKVDKVEME